MVDETSLVAPQALQGEVFDGRFMRCDDATYSINDLVTIVRESIEVFSVVVLVSNSLVEGTTGYGAK